MAKKTHGGKRQNSGRKKVAPYENFSFRIENKIMELITKENQKKIKEKYGVTLNQFIIRHLIDVANNVFFLSPRVDIDLSIKNSTTFGLKIPKSKKDLIKSKQIEIEKRTGKTLNVIVNELLISMLYNL